ncbi:MAG: ABC transporter ATP-binding protein [Erysipelotrichaceae bacterium]|nr:ABC transporter ATP-binding protein [Erysipelotrichaceae bacterium]
MKYFKRLLELIGNHKKIFYIGIVFAFIKSFSMIFTFVAINYGFKNLNTIDGNKIFTIVMILIGGIIWNFSFGYLENILLSAEGYHIYKNYRLNVGIKLKKAPLGYFNQQHLGDIQGALTTNLVSLENFTMMLVTDITNGFASSIVLTIAFFNMHISLGLYMVVALILIAYLLLKIYAVASEYVPQIHDVEREMNFAVIDLIRGMSVLRCFANNKELEINKNIHNIAYDTYEQKRLIDIKCEVAYSWKAKLYSLAVASSTVISIILSLVLNHYNIIETADTLTMIVASFVIFLGLYPLSDGAFLYSKVPSHQKYIDSVLDIPEITDGSIDEVNGPKDLSFENVSFSYDTRKVIKDVSFDIKEGQKIAIVGPSGSGKTTLVNLITRFWDVDSGRITLSNKDIRSYHTETLLKQLSIVFQEVYLFNDTIMNNIKFAKPDTTDEEVYEVCKKARCHDFISKLPNGYNTVLGEGGANVSGGEKQRISIARALLKDAPIILLDEATSSVDPENEAEIIAAINNLCQNKTVISIAHRLSTVEQADKILVIDDGMIKESGTHQELLALNGIYAGFIKTRLDAKGWRVSN